MHQWCSCVNAALALLPLESRLVSLQALSVPVGALRTRVCSNAWPHVWRSVDPTPRRFGLGPARDFASHFSGLGLLRNLWSNLALWMDAYGCLVTCASTGGKTCGGNSNKPGNRCRPRLSTRS